MPMLGSLVKSSYMFNKYEITVIERLQMTWNMRVATF
nr:MAG TPA: Get5 C-terminal domain [Caudoviricetes sp.]